MSTVAQPAQEITVRAIRTPKEAARQTPCIVCYARPRGPCERSPESDHLARLLDAHANGAIRREAMAAVLARIEVIAKWVTVPAACPCCELAGQSDTPQLPDPDVA